MKRSLFLLLLILICFSAAGQKTKNLTDQVKLRCSYLFTKRTTAEEKPFRTDTMYLDIGDKISRFYDPA
ncbi:MAG TPA: hypothetical protein VKB19_00020, partial [Pedobacter sp.]|nr:hypothetical protein [Pedobacter sp.]